MNLKLLIGVPLAAAFIVAALAILVWGWMLWADKGYAREVYFSLRASGWTS